jgi:hypothetical protein
MSVRVPRRFDAGFTQASSVTARRGSSAAASATLSIERRPSSATAPPYLPRAVHAVARSVAAFPRPRSSGAEAPAPASKL